MEESLQLEEPFFNSDGNLRQDECNPPNLSNQYEDGRVGNINEEDSINPMLLPTVVKTIMKNMKPDLLLNCRQVCKLWCKEATTYLQQKGRVVFDSDKENRKTFLKIYRGLKDTTEKVNETSSETEELHLNDKHLNYNDSSLEDTDSSNWESASRGDSEHSDCSLPGNAVEPANANQDHALETENEEHGLLQDGTGNNSNTNEDQNVDDQVGEEAGSSSNDSDHGDADLHQHDCLYGANSDSAGSLDTWSDYFDESDTSDEDAFGCMNYLDQHSPCNSLMPEYMDYLLEDPGVRYQRIKVEDINLNHPIAKTFFRNYGSVLRELTLVVSPTPIGRDMLDMDFEHFDDDDDVGNDENIISVLLHDPPGLLESHVFLQILEDCCNLRTLFLELPQSVTERSFMERNAEIKNSLKTKIRELHIDAHYKVSILKPAFMNDLFSVCPHLEDFSLAANYNAFMVTKVCIKALENTGLLCNLKRLSCPSVGSWAIQKLSQFSCDLRLTKLELNRIQLNGNSNYRFMQTLFEGLSDNLQSLQIKDTDATSVGCSLVLSKMSALKTLDISGSSVRPCDDTCCLHKIPFAEQFPNLEELIMFGSAEGYNLNRWFGLRSVENANLLPQTKLKILELPIDIGDEKLLDNIGMLLPNVTTLVLGYERHSVFRSLWRSWKNLQNLYMSVCSPTFNESKDFLGLDHLLCGTYAKGKNDSKEALSIKNLQDLRQLYVLARYSKYEWRNSINAYNKDKITNYSIDHAFKFLPNLDVLYIEPHEISSEALTNLANGLKGNYTVNVNLCLAAIFPAYFDSCGTRTILLSRSQKTTLFQD